MKLFSDEVLVAVVPVVVYWMYSGMYMAFGKSMDKYRLNPKVYENSKNMVSKRDVVRVVLTQQLVQLLSATILTKIAGGGAAAAGNAVPDQPTSYYYYLITVERQLAVAVIFYDGWHYVWHRTLHSSRFLYRNIHSWHHRLVVPYAFGALYNHPLEGLLVDNLGGACAFLISGMSLRVAVFFFSLCIIKGIDNHCGMCLPFNPSFWTNAAYHEVHHQSRGSQHNYSNLFFTTWDKVFGTYMAYTIEERPEEGTLRVRPVTKTMAKKSVLSE